jgi:ABC-type enterochelin transport system permease subunit
MLAATACALAGTALFLRVLRAMPLRARVETSPACQVARNCSMSVR